jgi:hypothetical protein
MVNAKAHQRTMIKVQKPGEILRAKTINFCD